MRKLACLLVVLSISWSGTTQINPTEVEIVRDAYGVPHIFAKTDAQVAYGLAWAHAEDVFKTI
jgi:acyl-homoserine-lactone acylase